MSAFLTIPVIKEIVGWLRNTELVEHLKKQVTDKEKEIDKLRRRLKKLEKLT